jgi:hypothetical protein
MGGEIGEKRFLQHGEEVTGWFLFAPLPEGVRAFTLFDGDQRIKVADVVLEGSQ